MAKQNPFIGGRRVRATTEDSETRALPTQFFYDNPLPPIDWTFASLDKMADTPEQCMAVAAFHACVRAIAEGVASLPWLLYRKTKDGNVVATSHPYYRLLHDRPNEYQTSYEFREQMVFNAAVHGNAYALKRYDSRGFVSQLVPIHPTFIDCKTLQNGEVVFDYFDPNGQKGRLTADDLIHVRYLSDNGLFGMSPVRLIRDVVTLAREMDTYATRFWANDAKPGVILETSQPIPEEAMRALRTQWQKMHQGPANAGRTAILPNGMSVKTLTGSTAEQAEMLELRTFVVQEIARAFRVPPSIIGELSHATYANVEQEALAFVQNTLTPWCCRLESAIDRGLLSDAPKYTNQLDVRGMLRGDTAARSAYYVAGLNNGWLAINEVRRLEDMPPFDNPAANEPFIAANNMQPLSEYGTEADSETGETAPDESETTEESTNETVSIVDG